MTEALELEITTPERQLVREHVSEVELPGKDGYMGILPGHAALLSELGVGHLVYATGRKRHYVAIHNGFVEVLNDHVRVLADAAERAEDINVERARIALGRSREQLLNPPAGTDNSAVLAAFERAEARIEVSQHRITE